jgi:hypothetical protein
VLIFRVPLAATDEAVPPVVIARAKNRDEDDRDIDRGT